MLGYRCGMPSKPSSKKLSLRDRLIVKPGSRVTLRDRPADETFGYRKEQAAPKVDADVERLAALQERFWAEHRRRLLIVLQGMDASGKDGVVKHVMTGFHPLGVHVVGFGVPSEVELAHDYLWRIHKVVPGNGEIVIFNRSHYEDVLIVRVREFVPKVRWS